MFMYNSLPKMNRTLINKEQDSEAIYQVAGVLKEQSQSFGEFHGSFNEMLTRTEMVLAMYEDVLIGHLEDAFPEVSGTKNMLEVLQKASKGHVPPDRNFLIEYQRLQEGSLTHMRMRAKSHTIANQNQQIWEQIFNDAANLTWANETYSKIRSEYTAMHDHLKRYRALKKQVDAVIQYNKDADQNKTFKITEENVHLLAKRSRIRYLFDKKYKKACDAYDASNRLTRKAGGTVLRTLHEVEDFEKFMPQDLTALSSLDRLSVIFSHIEDRFKQWEEYAYGEHKIRRSLFRSVVRSCASENFIRSLVAHIPGLRDGKTSSLFTAIAEDYAAMRNLQDLLSANNQSAIYTNSLIQQTSSGLDLIAENNPGMRIEFNSDDMAYHFRRILNRMGGTLQLAEMMYSSARKGLMQSNPSYEAYVSATTRPDKLFYTSEFSQSGSWNPAYISETDQSEAQRIKKLQGQLKSQDAGRVPLPGLKEAHVFMPEREAYKDLAVLNKVFDRYWEGIVVQNGVKRAATIHGSS